MITTSKGQWDYDPADPNRGANGTDNEWYHVDCPNEADDLWLADLDDKGAVHYEGEGSHRVLVRNALIRCQGCGLMDLIPIRSWAPINIPEDAYGD